MENKKKENIVNNSFLELETQKKIKTLKQKTLSEDSTLSTKPKTVFLYPSKKPLNYTNVTTKIETRSKVLKEKDYLKAKNIFNLIKKGKWISAIQQTKKVKDKEFKNLVTWLYLKEPGNQATFNDYKNFISENSDYPRIGRLKYMAEHKIILENSSPQTIINWFGDTEPLSGTGKIKLGEAYLKVDKSDEAISLIKTGWVNADLSSRDVKYYRKKI